MTPIQRPFWKRKRWIAAAILWLIVSGYLLNGGLIYYAAARGWLSRSTVEAYMQPLETAYDWGDVVGDVYDDFLDWCKDTGENHAASK